MKNPIPQDEWLYYVPMVGVASMLELGNKKNPDGVYKDYFESLGIRHVSIDWNGENGALKLDLRTPIKPQVGTFDMVTNIGTTEHVSNQTAVWENIHNCCHVGGAIVSVTPRPGDWWWHGEWYPTGEFFREFARLNGYRVDLLGIERGEPFRNNCARLVKERCLKFTMPALNLIYKNTRRPRGIINEAKVEGFK